MSDVEEPRFDSRLFPDTSSSRCRMFSGKKVCYVVMLFVWQLEFERQCTCTVCWMWVAVLHIIRVTIHQNMTSLLVFGISVSHSFYRCSGGTF